MDIFETTTLIPLALFLLSLASGIWLMRVGRPLNVFIFTIHKLAALAGVIFAGKTLFNYFTNLEIPAPIFLFLGIFGVCVLALFISGAFLSREKPINKVLLLVHRTAPVALVLSVAGIMFNP